MTQQELQHLYWRIGFGMHPKSNKTEFKHRISVVEALFESSKAFTPLNIDLSYLDGIKPIDLKNFPELAREINQKST